MITRREFVRSTDSVSTALGLAPENQLLINNSRVLPCYSAIFATWRSNPVLGNNEVNANTL
jgi:hypothetical protein